MLAKCGAGIAMVLVLGVILTGSGFPWIALAASECDCSFKIDVGIYRDVNPKDNPINADPADTQEFHFHVTWIITRTLLGFSGPFFIDAGKIGDYTASQGNTVEVPKMVGQSGEKKVDYCLPVIGEAYPANGPCFGLVWPVIESVTYDIDHDRIPAGYCPQYPDGQDRKKEGTTTENMKFYRGDACGKVYPGWDGRFDWGACRPRQCYIMIQ